jgi:hypothetical protein
MLGLIMANPASSQGLIQVLQSFIPLLPVVNTETGARQLTFVGCDKNFYEQVPKLLIFSKLQVSQSQIFS